MHNIPGGFEVHVKYRFELLNLIEQEPEVQPETRNIFRKECEKIMPEVRRREKSSQMTKET